MYMIGPRGPRGENTKPPINKCVTVTPTRPKITQVFGVSTFILITIVIVMSDDDDEKLEYWEVKQ